jgi:hypothetical protein
LSSGSVICFSFEKGCDNFLGFLKLRVEGKGLKEENDDDGKRLYV